jgi:hypothetical protein
MATDIPTVMRKQLRVRSFGVCERCSVSYATEAHHRQRRRDGGHRLSNLAHLCGGCHRWAHTYPTLAQEDGWIVAVHDDPAAVPMKHFTCLRYFDDLGGVRREDQPQRQEPQTDPTRR